MRRAWLAGSLPGATPHEAMELALARLGPRTLFLPGGETSRPNWSWAGIIDELAETDLFSVAHPGAWTDYADAVRLTPQRNLTTLDLGYYEQYLRESAIAAELTRAWGLALTFQVGIISPFALSTATVGPGRHLLHHKAFIEATLRDVMKIYMSDESVVFQIEAPHEFISAMKSPSIGRSLIIKKLVHKVTDFVSRCPQGMRIGIHPCLGDLNHRAAVSLTGLETLVDWINELCEHWPRGYTLAYVQLPLCAGERPPELERQWYTDLMRLRVPPGVRVVAGLCHEQVTAAQLRPVLATLDALLARSVDVGASCGLAHGRSLDEVYTVLDQQAELCQ